MEFSILCHRQSYSMDFDLAHFCSPRFISNWNREKWKSSQLKNRARKIFSSEKIVRWLFPKRNCTSLWLFHRPTHCWNERNTEIGISCRRTSTRFNAYTRMSSFCKSMRYSELLVLDKSSSRVRSRTKGEGDCIYYIHIREVWSARMLFKCAWTRAVNMTEMSLSENYKFNMPTRAVFVRCAWCRDINNIMYHIGTILHPVFWYSDEGNSYCAE